MFFCVILFVCFFSADDSGGDFVCSVVDGRNEGSSSVVKETGSVCDARDKAPMARQRGAVRRRGRRGGGGGGGGGEGRRNEKPQGTTKKKTRLSTP